MLEELKLLSIAIICFFKVFLTDRFEDEGYNWNKCIILVCFIDVVVILLYIRLSVVIAYFLYTSFTRAEYSWTCNSIMSMTTSNIPNQALIHVLISKFWSPCQLTVGIKYELSILTMSCNCLFIQIYIAHIQKKMAWIWNIATLISYLHVAFS